MSIDTRSAGGTGVPAAEDIQQQIHRIAISAGFKNSDPIRQVLLFLAKQAVECPGQAVKEHQIATSALGRSADFDPRVDSTVRVVVTRLRARLAEYYTHEGTNDPVVVDIPKGAYVLSFSYRQGNAVADAPNSVVEPATPVHQAGRARAVRWAIACVTLIAVATGAFWMGRRPVAVKKPAALARFWDVFLKSGDPLIVFSNPIFVGTPESGMHLLDPSAFHTDGTNDTFTGTGAILFT